MVLYWPCDSLEVAARKGCPSLRENRTTMLEEPPRSPGEQDHLLPSHKGINIIKPDEGFDGPTIIHMVLGGPGVVLAGFRVVLLDIPMVLGGPGMVLGGPGVVLAWFRVVLLDLPVVLGGPGMVLGGPRVVLAWSCGGPAVVPRCSRSGPAVVPRWSCGGPAVVLRWSYGGPAVVLRW